MVPVAVLNTQASLVSLATVTLYSEKKSAVLGANSTVTIVVARDAVIWAVLTRSGLTLTSVVPS